MPGPGGLSMVSPYEPFKNRFSVCYSLVALVDTRSVDFQREVFWGPVSQVQALKVRIIDVVFKSFPL